MATPRHHPSKPAVREGRWDCQYCGTIGILGRHKQCPICATNRPHKTRFYLLDHAEEVKDEKFLEYAHKGPDWICSYCGASNSATHKVCQTCFADRTADAQLQEIISYDLESVPTRGDMADPTDSRPTVRQINVNRSSLGASPLDLAGMDRRIQALPKWPGVLIGIFIVIVLGVILVNNARLNRVQEVTAIVQSYSWSRSIRVESYETVTESDWTLPAAGRLLSSQEAIRRYDTIPVGTERRSRQVPVQVYVGENSYVCGSRDLGNGFFEDVYCSEPIYDTVYETETYDETIYTQVPVYDTEYTYEIEKWLFNRTETAEGISHTAEWPEVNYASNEREASTEEYYEITFTTLTEERIRYTESFPYDRWLDFTEGNRVRLLINGRGEVLGLAGE